MTRKETTKAALLEAAPGKRYVHVAPHGWFAPESVKSMADARPVDSTRMSLEDRIAGLAPMTLCGLALAGANRGRDSLGRVPGILTAEELCSLDLSQCELAVLSACETWASATRRLFEVFYTKLWQDEVPKARALWEAKSVLREEGAPVRDWAGWVLTGTPD